MNVAFIRQRYVPTGGAERYLDALMKEVSLRGHHVHLLANTWSLPAHSKVQLHHIPTFALTSVLRMLTFASGCKTRLRQLQPDLVFSLERTLQQDIYRAGDGCHREWLRQRKRHLTPWKRAQVMLNPFHQAVLTLEKKVFSPARTKLVIANSRRGKDEIVSHYRFPAECIQVVYNGVDCTRFAPRPKSKLPGNTVLLFAGSGFERKGLRFCLQALARLPARFHLQIIGKGPRAAYESLAEKLQIASRLRFIEPALDMAPLYHSADILMHPAIYEPFANVCLEAMASGLPVVTTRANGVAEIIVHGQNGAVVDAPDDSESLAAAAQFLEASLPSASAHARATAERFTLAGHVRNTMEAIEAVRAI